MENSINYVRIDMNSLSAFPPPKIVDMNKPVETLLHTPIFDVVKAPEVQAGFNPVQVKSKDWVTVIVENQIGQFMVETQLRYGLMEICEEFPCGMVEEGEDPRNAAWRELKEETGYDVDRTKFVYLGKFAANPAFMTNHMHYFYIRLGGDVDYSRGKTDFDEHEKLTSYWKYKEDVYRDYLKSGHSAIMAGGWLFLKENGII